MRRTRIVKLHGGRGAAVSAGEALIGAGRRALEIACVVTRLSVGELFRRDPATGALELVTRRGQRRGRGAARAGGTRLAVPIRVGGVPWGELVLSDAKRRRLDREATRLVEMAAEQVGFAVALTELVAEAGAKPGRLEALVRLAGTLTATLSLDEVLRQVGDAAVELLGYRGARLWLIDDDGRHLSLRASAGARVDLQGERRIPVDAGLVGAVVTARAPLAVADALGDPRLRNREEFRAEGLVSFAGAPLVAGGRVRGALVVATGERHEFTADELTLLGALADHAAVAIDNARRFADEQARQASLAAVLEINKKIGVTPMETLLGAIAEEALKLLGVDNAGFRLVDGDDLVIAGLAGTARETMLRPRIKVGESVSGKVAANRRPLVCEIDAIPDVIPEHLAADRRLGYTSFLGVPLWLGDRVIGVLTFRARRPFTARDQDIAEAFAGQAAIAIEHSRLYNEAARQAARMTALAEVGRALSETLDPDVVGQRIADSVCALLGARSSCLYRIEPESGDLVQVTVSSDARRVFQWIPVLAPDTGAAGLAVRERRAVALPDTLADPRIRYTPDNRAWLAGTDQRAMLAAPLVVPGRLLGALAVGDRTGRTFTEDDVRLAQAFADQAALALENARLFSLETARRRQIETLADVERELAAELDADRLLGMIVERASRLFEAVGVIWLEHDGVLVQRAWSAGAPIADEPLEVGRGLTGQCAQRRLGAIVNDYAASPHALPRFVALGFTRAMAQPLISHERLLGVIVMGRAGGDAPPFLPDDLATLARFATHAAIALENARLYTDARERLRETGTLLAIGAALSQPGPLEEMMRRVAREVAHAFEADMVGAYALDATKERLVPLGGFHVPEPLVDRFLRRPIVLARLPALLPAWREGRAVWSSDVLHDPRFDPEWLEGLPPHSVLFASAKTHGESFGGLFLVWWRVGRAFPPAEIRLLEGVAAQAGLAMENAELSRQTQIKLRETETLLSVSRALSSTLDPEALLRHFLRQVTGASGADTVGVWMLDESGAWLLPLAGYHVPPEWLPAVSTVRLSTVDDPFYAEAARTKRPVFSSDAAADPRIPEALRAAAPHRSQLFVPIVAKERLIGGFAAVWWDEARRLSDGELALMEAIANQAGVAIENARLFQQNQRQVEELSVLHELSRAVTGQLDRVTLIDAIRTQVARVFDVRNMVILLKDEEQGDFEMALRVIDGVRTEQPSHRYSSRSLGLMAVVLATGQAVRTDDYLAECARRGVEPFTGAPPLRHWLGVPMTAGDAVLGVLTLRAGERPFTAAEEQLLTDIGQLAALALRSARLFEERARAYAELAAAQDQLVRTEKLRALGEMASGVAHDFNNLLASILGRAQLGLQRVQDPQLRQWLTVIERSALDGAQTVRRLQELTRIRRDEPFVAVDLNQVVREALEMTQSRWREELRSRGIALEIRTSLAALPPVAGDPPELREALTNLILNAVDAMPQGGVLSVTTTVQGEEIELTVADTGVGIPESVKHRIFDPFFTTKGPQGTGLGLAMTYGILSRHGARITVESAEGHGSTFRLTFALGERLGDVAGELPAALPSGASLRCLVVDDEEAVGAMLGDVLETGGHRAVVVSDGAEAIARFSAEPFDLVLTDLAMPRVSGWQVAGAVKEMAPSVPVLLVTGFGVELSPEALRAHGIDAVLVKPVKIDEILAAVARFARKRARETR